MKKQINSIKSVMFYNTDTQKNNTNKWIIGIALVSLAIAGYSIFFKK